MSSSSSSSSLSSPPKKSGKFKVTHGDGIKRITEEPYYRISTDCKGHALMLSVLDDNGKYLHDVVLVDALIDTPQEVLWANARIAINNLIKTK